MPQYLLMKLFPALPSDPATPVYPLARAFAPAFVFDMIARLRAVASDVRHWLGPLTVDRKEKDYLELLARTKPHLVHALRIPFEGMLAGLTPAGIPVILSTWGNDLTYHAETTNAMAANTRRALLRANGLMSDTQRDLRLARSWSFNPAKPSLTVPGNGGIDLGEIEQSTRGVGLAVPWQVINPKSAYPINFVELN